MLLEEGAENFRKNTFCFLGTWHVFKMASTCVWRMAGPDFIAPLFHDFFPTSPFPWAPRLVLSTRIFSLIRLAYPSFRQQLNAALEKEALTNIQKSHLLNLRSLCEWLIPKVCIFFVLHLYFIHLYPFCMFALPLLTD